MTETTKTQTPSDVLRFTPTAWEKINFIKTLAGEREFSAFGVSKKHDWLLVRDIVCVKEVRTSASAIMNDQAVANYFDDMLDKGHTVEEFSRIWIHSHPWKGHVSPSSLDYETFARVFGKCEWAIMLILGRRDEDYYCNLRFNVGPGANVPLRLKVDWHQADLSQQEAWRKEFLDTDEQPPSCQKIIRLDDTSDIEELQWANFLEQEDWRWRNWEKYI